MQIDEGYIVKIRRELHEVPELGFDLPKSKAIICRELDAMGIPYTEQYGKSSIVATLNEGVGNKTIALRADYDALPIQEETGLPFASKHSGKMHACGHDAHAAMLLGTAKALKAMEKDINCCVKFLFQSAEETLEGGKAVCNDGFMDQVDEIISCHVYSHGVAGTVSICPTCNSACSRGFYLHLYGKPCHAARPHLGVDAIAMAVRVYTDIQFMRARELNPMMPVVIAVGAIHGGTVNNVVCDHVTMNVSVRTQTTEMDEHIYKRITEIAENVAKDMGGSAKLETYKHCPPLWNEPKVTNGIRAAAEKVLGRENTLPKNEGMGADDFAYYLQHKPGCIFYPGVATEGQPISPTHSSKFLLDERSLVVGPKVFIQYILDNMEK